MLSSGKNRLYIQLWIKDRGDKCCEKRCAVSRGGERRKWVATLGGPRGEIWRIGDGFIQTKSQNLTIPFSGGYSLRKTLRLGWLGHGLCLARFISKLFWAMTTH
ncbi:hypothetical protein SLE2022_073690 [Rubroshorea leprosula]